MILLEIILQAGILCVKTFDIVGFILVLIGGISINCIGSKWCVVLRNRSVELSAEAVTINLKDSASTRRISLSSTRSTREIMCLVR